MRDLLGRLARILRLRRFGAVDESVDDRPGVKEVGQ
jgi:hypothetical protein